jgi:hypothetical protein
MKHIRKMTVAKAEVFTDIGDFFTNLWDEISGFFKDLFGGNA